MSKKCLLSFLSYCAFSALSLTVMHLFLLLSVNQWVGVGCGAGIFVGSLIILFLLRKKLKKKVYMILSFAPFNAIACGLSISSLFVYFGKSPLVWQSAAVWGALVTAFAIYCLFTNLSFFRNHYVICMIVFALLLFAGAIAGVCLSSVTVFSLAIMMLVVFCGLFITLAVKASSATEHLKHITVATYSLLLVVIVIVLLVLSEGEGADGLDFSTGGGKLKRNPYVFEP